MRQTGSVRQQAVLSTGKFEYLHWPGPDPAAPPAVLLHGLTSSAAGWDQVAEALRDRHRVYALSLRGHGGSAGPPGSAYAPERFAADVREFLASLALHRPLLVGHSWGGAVALLAATSGADPRGLILEDPVHSVGTDRQRRMAGRWLDLQLIPESERRSRLRVGPPPLDAEAAARRSREILATSPHALRHIAAPGTPPRTLLPELVRVPGPVLLMRADPALGGIVDDEAASVAAGLLPPGSRSVLLAGTPHTIHSAAPSAFVSEMNGFLADVLDRAPAGCLDRASQVASGGSEP